MEATAHQKTCMKLECMVKVKVITFKVRKENLFHFKAGETQLKCQFKPTDKFTIEEKKEDGVTLQRRRP